MSSGRSVNKSHAMCTVSYIFSIFFHLFLQGNNIFGEDIRHLLSKNDGSRTQYILMEKIFPPVLKNYVVQVHKKEIEEEDVISEFGVFGVVIRCVHGTACCTSSNLIPRLNTRRSPTRWGSAE